MAGRSRARGALIPERLASSGSVVRLSPPSCPRALATIHHFVRPGSQRFPQRYRPEEHGTQAMFIANDDFRIDSNQGSLETKGLEASETHDKPSSKKALRKKLKFSARMRKLGITLGASDAPRWYRAAEILAVGAAITCFTTISFNPAFAIRWALDEVEKLIAVLFFVDFLFKWWARRFALGWLTKWKTLIEIVSSLPALDILLVQVNFGFSKLGALLNTLRLFRLISISRTYTDRFSLGSRILLVFTTLAGVVANSASMIWMAEAGHNPNMKSPIDAVFFALSALTAEGVLFPLVTTNGKIIGMLTIVVGLSAIIPQLADAFITASANRKRSIETAVERSFWAHAIRKIDEMEVKGLFAQDNAAQLRQYCINRDEGFGILLEAYKTKDESSLASACMQFIDESAAITEYNAGEIPTAEQNTLGQRANQNMKSEPQRLSSRKRDEAKYSNGVANDEVPGLNELTSRKYSWE